MYHGGARKPFNRIEADAEAGTRRRIGVLTGGVTVSPHLAPRQRATGALGAGRAGHKSFYEEDADHMTAVNVFAPVRPARRAATYLTAAAALAVGTSLALAQTQSEEHTAELQSH